MRYNAYMRKTDNYKFAEIALNLPLKTVFHYGIPKNLKAHFSPNFREIFERCCMYGL